jgi:phage-related protein
MNVFELFATIKLDTSDYEKGMERSKEQANSFGSKFASGMKSALKVGTAVMGAASAAVGLMTKSAVSGFAEQQQLVGGVQKLYGNMGQSVEEYAKSTGKSVDQVKGEWDKLEKAQNTVLDNARNAYKTSGMSMNEYMDTATSFSAALINSLGGDTQKAAEQTDVAMRAISDNFNTFGGDIGMIQGAFQGFAKQNYTMLDNLKLGYGGTKTEMERLVKDANEYAKANGQAANLSVDSFSDIVTAIDLIQKKQNIAGTTAREAASTVEGSLSMLRSAWTNLLSGLGDKDADMGTLINNVVESAKTAFENLLPVVETALTGIGDLIAGIAPILADNLPTLISEVVPKLVASAGKLVSALGNGLIQNLPLIIQSGIKVVQTLIQGIGQALPQIISGAGEVITELANGLSQALPTLIPAIWEVVLTIYEGLIDNIDTVVDAAIEIITAFAEGVIAALPVLVEKAPTIIAKLAEAIINNVPKILRAGIQIIRALINGINSALGQLFAPAGKAVNQFGAGIARGFAKMVAKGKELVGKVISGIKAFFGNLRSIGGQVIDAVKSGITGKISEALQWGKDLMGNLIQGIKNKIGELGGVLGGVGKKIKGVFGHSHPTEGPMKDDYKWMPDMMDLFIKGIRDNESKLQAQARRTFDLRDTIQNGLNPTANPRVMSDYSTTYGDTNVYLNYDASNDANDMLRDLARGVKRYRMAGVI